MKTVEELVKEINGSKELQKEIKAIKNDDEFEAFLKNNGCGASTKEYLDYVESLNEGEIEDDDAKAAAGGRWNLRPDTIKPHLR